MRDEETAEDEQKRDQDRQDGDGQTAAVLAAEDRCIAFIGQEHAVIDVVLIRTGFVVITGFVLRFAVILVTGTVVRVGRDRFGTVDRFDRLCHFRGLVGRSFEHFGSGVLLTGKVGSGAVGLFEHGLVAVVVLLVVVRRRFRAGVDDGFRLGRRRDRCGVGGIGHIVQSAGGRVAEVDFIVLFRAGRFRGRSNDDGVFGFRFRSRSADRDIGLIDGLFHDRRLFDDRFFGQFHFAAAEVDLKHLDAVVVGRTDFDGAAVDRSFRDRFRCGGIDRFRVDVRKDETGFLFYRCLFRNEFLRDELFFRLFFEPSEDVFHCHVATRSFR